MQTYLKSVNDLWKEFQERKVGVFGVCGQPKGEVDLMVSENNLRFKVHVAIYMGGCGSSSI